MTKKLLLASLLLLTACSSKATEDDKVIRVASHTTPMTTVVEMAKEILVEEGYTLELVSVADNTAGNIALNNKEIDANFFQHVPFMEAFNTAHKGELVGITPIYDAIIAFYSKSYDSKDAIKDGSTVGVPNDPNNLARALLLLQAQGLLSLKDGGSYTSILEDIVDNPLNLKFYPVDLLTLTQAYEDVDLVFNYPTYAGKIGLFPLVDGIMVEESTGYFAISLVAREDNKDSDKIKALTKAMTSDKIREFLTNEENSRTLVPSF